MKPFQTGLGNARPAPSEAVWVIADSLAALTYARRQGVPESARIETASPALLAERALGARAIDACVTPEAMTALHEATLALSRDVFAAMRRGPLAKVALALARVPVSRQAVFYRAMLLRQEHFVEPGVVAEIDTGRADLNQWLSSPLAILLKECPSVRVITAPPDEIPAPPEVEPPVAGFLSRLKHASAQSVAYRILCALSRRLHLPVPCGDILILRENELLKETALWLALRGFGIRPVQTPSVQPEPLAGEEDALLSQELERLFAKHIAPLLVAPAHRPMLDLYLGASRQACETFRAMVPGWCAVLSGPKGRRARAVFSNSLATPAAEALYAACQEKRIPFFMFQHGMTREICQRVASYKIFMENCAADYSVLFNAESVRQEGANPFARGTPILAGMPRDYHQMGADGPAPGDAPPIWYVSLCLYLGNTSLLNFNEPDHAKAARERDIIEALARVPHRVLYKPYPGKRYIDPDPVLEEAANYPNIEVYRDRIDLRYIVRAARVIVTARAGGTFAWCYMSGKPVVFVNFPDQAPLREEVRPLFERAVFTFGAANPDWQSELAAFLSQPIEEIEEQWAARADARCRLTREFFDAAEGRGGGRSASQAIYDAIARERYS